MDVNGMTPSTPSQPGKKCTSYKLLVDPNIKKNCQKLIRYDGIVPGQMGQQLSVKFVKDPRSRLTRLWRDTEVADLPIPKMKFDKYYVGELPPKQIMFTNLNDNVREPFLRSMAEKYGKVEDITIHRHPKTSKHLGLASVTYSSTRAARQAALELNRMSVMGKIIIVQIDAGGKECQRIFDCLVANKPSTPSSVGSTPRVDPRNGTPMSAPDTPRGHSDPRRSSLERSASVVTDTPASSISSSTPGFMPPESQGNFPAFTEQPVQQFQGMPDPSDPQFQMPEQPSQQDLLMHSMNSVTLQGYEHLQNVYAAQQAAQQAGYAQQHVEQVPHTPTVEMYAQQTPVQVQEGFTIPQTPSVPPVPDPHLLYGHQQHPAVPQDPQAGNFQASQPYQTQPLNVQGYPAHELPIQSQTERQEYPSSSAADNSKQYQKLDHAQSSKKQNYMARTDSHHTHSEDSQESFQSRSYQSHSGRGQRHSIQSGSKRYDDDRSSKRYDDDRGSKRYDDDRHDYRDDRSKKWDRRDRQDYRSNKRNERQRYRSQDYSEEDDEDGGSYRQKDHRRGHYRSRDSSDRHRYNDSYHKKSYRKEDEEDEHESGRSYKGGFKNRGYDKKYSDSRTYRDDNRDRKKPRDFEKEESVDYFAKWRCPTMKDQEIKPKEESYEFEKWECPTGKPIPPAPVRETNKFDQCHPPGEEPPSASPEDVSPFEEWQCPPGEEPPPGTMPLVLPSQPFPPGVQEEPLATVEADKASQSDGEETDFALSLDTRIEKLLKSSQGPMAGFPGIQLEDSGNADKNSSTTTLPPPGTEEPTFSQSEESVRTSDPETNTNYMKPEEQWGRYRQEQLPRTDQREHKWAPGHLPHSHAPDPVHHPRLDHLKVNSNGNDAFARQHSTPTPPGGQSASATPPPGKMSQGVELLISKQLANLRNYDQQIASRDTSPVSDLMRDRSQTSTPGIEDYHMHRGSMQYTPMDTAADDDDDKMSLSPLSSGEDTKIVVNVPIPEKKPQAPRMSSMPYATSQASWNSNLNQRSTNVVNAWAAQMMPPTSAGNAQMNPQGQAQTSGYRPNPMFPPGPPPSLPGMPPQAAMEAFIDSMRLPSSSSSPDDMPTPAQLMQMMASMGMPPPSIGPDGLPDVKPEQLANFPGQLNLFNSPDMLPFNMPRGFPGGSVPNWMAAPFMPPIPDTLLPSFDKPHRDPEKELVNEVLKTVIQEMKLILKKDLNRKMVETKAFKSFEAWWDTCQLMAKAKDMMKPKEEEKVHKKPPPAIPSMLESSFSSFGMEGLGLGLRANMPRMPSFKVKRKPASPPPEDEVGDVDDDIEAVDKKRPFTPPVIDEDSDEMSDTEQDEITEISSQTSEPHVLDRRERAKRARDLIYSSSSDEEEEDEDKDADVEKELEEEEEEDEEEEEEEEEDEEDEEEEEEEDEEVEDLEEEVAMKDMPKKKLEKTPPRKDEVTTDDLDKEEESRDTQESETPSKLTTDKPSLSEASDVESDEDWTESSSSSETESSSSESDTAESDSDEEDTEGKASGAKKAVADEKEDRLGAFEILVEMATKAKDKLDQSSSDTDKGGLGDMEMSDIQAAQSLQALRHASETSEVGEMMAFKGDASATLDESSEKTMSGSEGELDVGDYKMLLTKQPKVVLEPLAIIDHTYCQKPTPSPDKVEPAPASEELKKQEVLTEKTTNLVPEVKYVTVDKEKDREEKQRQKAEKAEKKKARKRKNELAKILEEEIVIPEPKVQEFKLRNYYEEWTLLYEFLRTGISHEDAYLIRKSYETLLEAGNFPWLSYTHWMAHPLTSCPDPPQAKKKKLDEESRVHMSGSARTEGYYKISNKEKVKYLTKARTYVQESVTDSSALDESTTKKRIEVSRDARSDQRRFIAVLQQQEEQVSNLFKFNQLQFRKKDLKFCKSSIHGWGLYAMEPIAADEMVIEYVGESVRQSIADSREKAYERMGIGSSYLFRIDAVTIIDATKSGNLARFINHSCNPNCYAKIITVESQKKIVIYSKQAINVGDEITYDYKFPIEDEKIPCLCGAAQCRGTLN